MGPGTHCEKMSAGPPPPPPWSCCLSPSSPYRSYILRFSESDSTSYAAASRSRIQSDVSALCMSIDHHLAHDEHAMKFWYSMLTMADLCKALLSCLLLLLTALHLILQQPERYSSCQGQGPSRHARMTAHNQKPECNAINITKKTCKRWKSILGGIAGQAFYRSA